MSSDALMTDAASMPEAPAAVTAPVLAPAAAVAAAAVPAPPAAPPADATSQADTQRHPTAQTQPHRPAALKGEDAWKRMNFLYQSAHRALLLSDSPLAANLSRWYMLNLRKVATKLVLRIDPSIKNSACKRCGVLLLTGRTAHTRIVSVGRQADDDDSATVSAEDAERLREWRQDQLQAAMSMPAVSAAPGPAPAVPIAAAATATARGDAVLSCDSKPASNGSPMLLNARQRRHQQRAEARLRLAKLGDTQTHPSQAAPSHCQAAAPAASEVTTAPVGVAASLEPPTAASASIAQHAATAATSAAAATAMSDVAPASAAVAAAAPLILQPTAAASSSSQRDRRVGRVRMSKIAASPHVVVTCLHCHTRKRINTKPPKQRPGAGE